MVHLVPRLLVSRNRQSRQARNLHNIQRSAQGSDYFLVFGVSLYRYLHMFRKGKILTIVFLQCYNCGQPHHKIWGPSEKMSEFVA